MMTKEEIMKKYKTGNLDSESMEVLEKYIEEGIIDLNELEDLEEMYSKIEVKEDFEEVSQRMSGRFYHFLTETSKQESKQSWWVGIKSIFSSQGNIQPVFLMAMFILVFISGITFNSMMSSKNEIASLNNELDDLKETMMLSMIEKPSTSDRLKAVHLSEETGLKNSMITEALLNTLNSDKSVNVRLAALEVLTQYVEDSTVREGLIRSITKQKNPIIQMHMVDIMTIINESRSIEEFNKLLEEGELEPEVEDRIKEGVNSLIQI